MRRANDYRPGLAEQEERAAFLLSDATGREAMRADRAYRHYTGLSRRAIFLCGYRDALSPDLRPGYRDVQCELPRSLLTDFARGWAAGVVAFGAGVDLSGGDA
jgi:hypothetical protein